MFRVPIFKFLDFVIWFQAWTETYNVTEGFYARYFSVSQICKVGVCLFLMLSSFTTARLVKPILKQY